MQGCPGLREPTQSAVTLSAWDHASQYDAPTARAHATCRTRPELPGRPPPLTSKTLTYALDTLPAGALPLSVTATPATISGRAALRVSLTDEIASHGVPNVDYIDMPTFVRIPADFTTGTIEVDVLSRLTSDAPEYARAFAGIAYHETYSDPAELEGTRNDASAHRFEAVYVRPMNGRKVSPPPPRDRRAVQYFAYPDWKFDRLREVYPDGRYEAGADVGPDEWMTLRVEVGLTMLSVFVNGDAVLQQIEAKSLKARSRDTHGNKPPSGGDVGLWVDIGTVAYFANLRLTRSD